MGPFYYFCIFYSLSSKKFLFWLFKYQGLVDFWSAPLSWEIILACHVPLDNSGAVFRYSIFTDYISIMFASFKSSCPYFIILIVKSFFFFSKMIYILQHYQQQVFFLLIQVQAIANIFYFDVSLNNDCFIYAQVVYNKFQI